MNRRFMLEETKSLDSLYVSSPLKNSIYLSKETFICLKKDFLSCIILLKIKGGFDRGKVWYAVNKKRLLTNYDS